MIRWSLVRPYRFGGRLPRLEFVLFMAATYLAYVGLAEALRALAAWVHASGFDLPGDVVAFLVVPAYGAALLAALGFLARRLQDADRAGAWAVLVIVPYANLALLALAAVAPPTRGTNRFGPDPRGGEGPTPPSPADA